MKLCHRAGTFLISTLVLLLISTSGHAEPPLPDEGQPIQSSNYRLDMFQGPVLAPARITELGGAYCAIAEGVNGMAMNIAAVAVRYPWSLDWWDYDVGLGFTDASSLKESDFDNNGQITFQDGTEQQGPTPYEKFLFATAGAQLQLGKWGIGTFFSNQTYHLGQTFSEPGKPANLNVTMQSGRIALGRSFMNGSLSVAVGLRLVGLDVTASELPNGDGENQTLVSLGDAAGEVGVLYAPVRARWRVGVDLRSAVYGKPSEGTSNDTVIAGRHIPEEVVLPWEIEAGFAYAFGPRPFNFGWVDLDERRSRALRYLKRKRNHTPKRSRTRKRITRSLSHLQKLSNDEWERVLRQRLQHLPRKRYVLVAAMQISGPVPRGVGIESFLQQRVQRSGEYVVVTPRVGFEFEPVAGRLIVRAGSYLEPSRFQPKLARAHGTLGFDVKVLPWTVFGLMPDGTYWRAGMFLDGARDYAASGMTLGVWH